MKMQAPRVWLAAILVALAGCAEVPKEAVTLSVTVGSDLEELRRSHLAAVTTLFDRTKRDVNRFIDTVYKPALIKRFFEQPLMGNQDPIAILRAELARDDAGDTLAIMEIIVEEVTDQIEEKRQELLAPIEEQERATLTAVNDAYANVLAGHAVVTAHLSSVRQVQEAQDQFLGDIGLADLRGRINETTDSVSGVVSGLLDNTRRADQAVDTLDGAIDDAVKALNAL